jgi:tetratricopeptide (TPR) repeat protein
MLTRKQLILENMVRAGWEAGSALQLIERVAAEVDESLRRAHLKRILISAGIAAFAFVLSFATYLQAVAAGGGRHVIAWGAVAFGLYYCYQAFTAWSVYTQLSRQRLFPEVHAANVSQQIVEVASQVDVDGQIDRYLALEKTGHAGQKLEARAALARLYENRGMLPQAESYCAKLIGEHQVDDLGLFELLARILERQGKTKDAARWYETVRYRRERGF